MTWAAVDLFYSLFLIASAGLLVYLGYSFARDAVKSDDYNEKVDTRRVAAAETRGGGGGRSAR